MRYVIILCLLGFMTPNSLGQGFQVKVKATHVVPDRKIYLEWINGRGQAIKVDSMLPNAQKEVNFKGTVIDQGGFYLVNFYSYHT